jgi:tetratricopeptide (TPR) repeat protein
MRRGTIALIALVALVIGVAAPAGASGVHSTVTIFESHEHPDLPLDKFADGRFGLIKPTWSKSYRYVVYRYFIGPAFDDAERKALVAMWNADLGLLPQPDASAQGPIEMENVMGPFTRPADTDAALAEWIAARNGLVPRAEQIDRIGIYRPAVSYFDAGSLGPEPSPGEFVGTFYFPNCNASSFRTAAATLRTMSGKFGASSRAVKSWLDAQDQVFTNCSGTPPHLKFENEQWPAAVDEWTTARNQVAGVAPAPSFSSNCKGANFHAAAAELGQMIARLGASNPEVKQWVSAKDQALVKCSAPPSYYTSASPMPTPAPVVPGAMTDGTPFERQQRRYQTASASFYAGRYDEAAKMFDEIASDASSPWHDWAKYLAARAIIRKATLSGPKNDPAMLAQAETRLHAVVASSSDASIKAAAQRLLSFIEFRLHPEQRVEAVAHALLQARSDGALSQDLDDYVSMFNYSTRRADGSYVDDMTDWISSFGPDHAVERWKTTGSTPWLIAALSLVHGSDTNASALLDAAARVKPASSAYVTVTFHVARILLEQGKIDDARTRLDALLAMRDMMPRTTLNEISRLRMKTARNLDELLTHAQRIPLGITSDDDNLDMPFNLDKASWWPAGQVDRVKALLAGPLFDSHGAESLSRWVPLSLQERAAESPILARNLRAQVAIAAWTRAIVLNKDDSARKLAPVLAELVPALKPELDTWMAEKNLRARRFDAAFILLMHPGMRPYIDAGIGRDTPLGEMNSLRDNWWGRIAPREQPSPAPVAGPRPEAATYPIFLSPGEKAASDEELRSMSDINAPKLLCSEAIDEAGRNPRDERVPQALSRCISAVHLGCSNDKGSELAKRAFSILQTRYAASEWGRKNRFWYKGTGCEAPTPTPSPFATP